MRFSCDSCDAQYSIADEKVRDRILRVQCKRCGSPILIKYESAEDDLPVEETDNEATKVMRQDDVRRAIEDAVPIGSSFHSKSSAARSDGRSGLKQAEAKEWFFLDKGQEVGPFTRAVMARYAESGRFTARTYVWRDGMPDWVRLEALGEFADILALVPTGPANAPQQPATTTASEVDSGEEFDEERTEIGSFELPDDEDEEEATQIARFDPSESEEHEEPHEPKELSLVQQLDDELADELVGESEGDLSHLLTNDAAMTGGAAASKDPFALVSDDPELLVAAPGETTNAVIKASGAKERRVGRIVVGGLVAVVAVVAILWFGGKSGVLVVPQAEPAPSKAPTTDWSKVKALDDSALGILSGENRKQEEEARRAAEAARRRAEADELAGLIPRDADHAGAIKRGRNTEPTVGLSPQQQAELARIREERAAGGGPGTAGPRQFVDTGFDVNRASKDGPDASSVAKKVGEAQPAISGCVTNALRRNPSQKVGKVVVVATIGSSGVVTRAEFRDDNHGIGRTELGDCVRKVVKNIVFPSFDGDAVDLEIPFLLSGG